MSQATLSQGMRFTERVGVPSVLVLAMLGVFIWHTTTMTEALAGLTNAVRENTRVMFEIKGRLK